MIAARVRAGRWADSAKLMAAARAAEATEGVERAACFMATPANLDDARGLGLYDGAMDGAGPNDSVIVVEGPDADAGLAAAEAVLDPQAGPGGGAADALSRRPRSMLAARGDLALISVPGEYAALEAHKALGAGMDVMLFSDGVTLEDEIALKRRARGLGRLVMGPGCGTAMLDGIGLGFANVVAAGPVGIVAAAGTGAQEVMVLVERAGSGISNCYGTGGRDLHEEVGAITAIDAIARLRDDPSTQVILCVSKPPSPAVASHVLDFLAGSGKPAAACFVGGGVAPRDGVEVVSTLEEAALAAARLAGVVRPSVDDPGARAQAEWSSGGAVRGLFSGGTLCSEASAILADLLGDVCSNAPAGIGPEARGRRGAGGPRGARPGRGGVHPRPAAPHDRPRGARRPAGRGGRRPGRGRAAARRRARLLEPPRSGGRAGAGDPHRAAGPPAAGRGGPRAGHRGRSPGALPPGGHPARPGGAAPADERRRRPAGGRRRRVRIRLLTYSTKPRGGVVHALCLAEELTARGHDAELWALSPDGARFFREPKAPVHLVPVEKREDEDVETRILRYAATLAEGLREAGPADLHHAEDCLSARSLLALRAEGRVPAVIRTVHHVDAFTSPVLEECQRASIQDVDHVLCVSRFWADILRDDFGVAARRGGQRRERGGLRGARHLPRRGRRADGLGRPAGGAERRRGGAAQGQPHPAGRLRRGPRAPGPGRAAGGGRRRDAVRLRRLPRRLGRGRRRARPDGAPGPRARRPRPTWP